ncbi:hypothetical protein L198_07698 [Cryptococcus wingfieldii CBS 7118]|uniref:Uncharacterized protein n=1 Tax=Cryptococcus wingfieldii CBS 7118 TaxID=1295528 RepID=A0A1E3I3N1_9TREE|nr:hypothetical protein L198_07698 [Cryptococcus wingfieldii CBS 7118]ODN82476.1 hypothetical protein L198_07698 [Cryptococcus wingfieldii CBS 7118]
MFRLAPRLLSRGHLRLLSTTRPRLNKGPPTTQGHTSTKDADDPQADSAHAAHAEKQSSNGSGEEEPFDAARQGGSGGEAKGSKTQATSGVDKGQSGAFKDQVGGQEGSDKGVEFGGQEPAAENTATQGLKNTNQGQGFEGLRKLREEGKNFHTSARAHGPAAEPTSPDAPGSRAPKESTPGDQNDHLKHSSSSTPDKGKGNAADDPHLPSQQGKGGSTQQTRKIHMSAARRAHSPPSDKYAKTHHDSESHAATSAPPEALPPHLESDYSAEATEPAPSNLKPSSQIPHSSSAVDPPHPVLSQQAKDGTLAERNTQPTAEMGRQGNDEAWKHRK